MPSESMAADWPLIFTVLLGCLLGGFVKGLSGSGLPQIAVPLIALLTSVPTAVAIVQLPAMAINLFQIRIANHPPSSILLHWPIVIVLFCATIAGVSMLRMAPPAVLFAFMGGITIAVSIFLALRPKIALPGRLRIVVGLPLALAAGLSAGLSSLSGPFLIPYFLSLHLPKDVFVATISLCYLAIIVPTIAFFLYWEIVSASVFAFSMIAIPPSLLGMWGGVKMRGRINEGQFRQIILGMLVASAIGLIWKAGSA